MEHEVCVVGAGGAGLATSYALRERGIPFRVLEAREAIGGMWRYGATFAYASLTSNTSRYQTSFRAHRITRRGPAFIHHTEFLRYLESYADRFGLRDTVELGARVTRAEPRAGGGWTVTVDGREPEPFRALVVASGGLSRPRRRDIPGDFAGRRLHSAEFAEANEFAGQDVVVTGAGSSALEIAGDLAETARSVTLAVRTGTYVTAKHVLPRFPIDLADTRLNSRLLPFSARREVVRLMIRRTMRRAREAGMPAPSYRLMNEPVALSDTFVRALRRGRVTIRPGVERLDGERVVLVDGSAARADALVEASGFLTDLGYLPAGLVDGYGEHHMPLYRGVMHVEQDDLFFVGFVAGMGALLPMFEAEAAWIAAVLSGALPYPSRAAREAGLAIEAERTERDFGRPYAVWRDRQRYIMALEREVKRATGRASRARAA